MTVAELVELLISVPLDEEVWIDVSGEYFYKIENVTFKEDLDESDGGHGVVLE